GTAGAVRWAVPRLTRPTVLVLNGDSYCDVNLTAFYEFHAQSAARASLVLARAEDAARFGSVWIDGTQRVQRFVEKRALPARGWINAGIYYLERTLIQEISLGCPRSLEQDLLPTWVQRFPCYGFPCAGRFLDIGTPEAYAAAEHFFAPALGP